MVEEVLNCHVNEVPLPQSATTMKGAGRFLEAASVGPLPHTPCPSHTDSVPLPHTPVPLPHRLLPLPCPPVSFHSPFGELPLEALGMKLHHLEQTLGLGRNVVGTYFPEHVLEFVILMSLFASSSGPQCSSEAGCLRNHSSDLLIFLSESLSSFMAFLWTQEQNQACWGPCFRLCCRS